MAKAQRQWVFSSESVAPGHPDKACDQISDLILDFLLERDPEAKVAAEAMISDKLLALCGEFKASPEALEEARVALPRKIQALLAKLYPDPSAGFDWERAKKVVEFKAQSPDIARGVELGGGQVGAGDQGLMFGYACDETDELMPMPAQLSQRLMRLQHEAFLAKEFPLGSDAKAQVTVRYEGRRPIEVAKVVLSTQHAASVSDRKLEEFVRERIINRAIEPHLRSASMEILVNPTGRFVVGGPQGDTGLTGRKIVVDTYGGAAPHGGGAFSGKDPSKVDRSASYMARALAKGIVQAGLSSRALVQIAYAIGRPQPVSVLVDFQGSALTSFSETLLEKVISTRFDLSPAGIIAWLDLKRPIYQGTATFGHFGRESEGFGWEDQRAGELIAKTLADLRA